jgi:hypothetical protein
MDKEKDIKIFSDILEWVLGSEGIHGHQILTILHIFLLIVLNVFGYVKE